MKTKIWKEVIRIVITILTSVATVFGVQSCTIESGNRYNPYEGYRDNTREVIMKDRIHVKRDSLVTNSNIYD